MPTAGLLGIYLPKKNKQLDMSRLVLNIGCGLDCQNDKILGS